MLSRIDRPWRTAMSAARQMGEGDIAGRLAVLLEVAEMDMLKNYPGLF